jgi:hypothetical protein
MNTYQRFQAGLLGLIVLLWVVLVGARICGVQLEEGLRSYELAIWAIILLLVDPKGLHERITGATRLVNTANMADVSPASVESQKEAVS